LSIIDTVVQKEMNGLLTRLSARPLRRMPIAFGRSMPSQNLMLDIRPASAPEIGFAFYASRGSQSPLL
jgi:hypothetical protein